MKVNLKKIYAELRKENGAKRLFYVSLREIAKTQKNEIVLITRQMTKNKMYSDQRDAARGLTESVDPLFDLKVSPRIKFFIEDKNFRSDKSRRFGINPKLDYKEIARGFGAIPERFVQTKAPTTNSKTLHVLGVIFIHAQDNINKLAKDGAFRLWLKDIQKTLGWKNIPPMSTMRAMKNAVENLNAMGNENGLFIEPSFNGEKIKDFMNRSYIDVTFKDDLLKNYLAEFGLEQKSPEDCVEMKIPFTLGESTEPQIISDSQIKTSKEHEEIIKLLISLDAPLAELERLLPLLRSKINETKQESWARILDAFFSKDEIQITANNVWAGVDARMKAHKHETTTP